MSSLINNQGGSLTPPWRKGFLVIQVLRVYFFNDWDYSGESLKHWNNLSRADFQYPAIEPVRASSLVWVNLGTEISFT